MSKLAKKSDSVVTREIRPIVEQPDLQLQRHASSSDAIMGSGVAKGARDQLQSSTAPAIAGRCVVACIRVTGAALHTVLRTAVGAAAAVVVAAWPCPGPKGYLCRFGLVAATMRRGCLPLPGIIVVCV
jgi:hypothetical protein